jgi:hypothetical protein
VHIGVHDLKQVTFVTLYPMFLKWSRNIVVSIDDLRLRNKDWVEMVSMSGVPDVDAIAAKFFVLKGKSKVVQFQAKGRVEVYLELQHEKYLEILTHLESDELETEHGVCHECDVYNQC